MPLLVAQSRRQPEGATSCRVFLSTTPTGDWFHPASSSLLVQRIKLLTSSVVQSAGVQSHINYSDRHLLCISRAESRQPSFQQCRRPALQTEKGCLSFLQKTHNNRYFRTSAVHVGREAHWTLWPLASNNSDRPEVGFRVLNPGATPQRRHCYPR
jgi:hypothetical protein